MHKKLIFMMFLLPICACHAYVSVEDMRRENEQHMDRMMDRLNEERYISEMRRANDEQERANRIIIQGQNRKLFGR